MDEEGLSCIICEEQYSDRRNPRALNCGHSFCTPCLNQLFMQNFRTCPECRAVIRNASVKTIPINYSLLRLVRPQGAQASKPSPKAVKEPNGGKCQAHGSIMFFWCVKCCTWVCRDCLVLDHPDPPRGSCVIKAPKEAAADMVQADNQKVKVMIADIEGIIKVMESASLHVEQQKKQSENRITALKQEMSELEATVQSYTAKQQEVTKNVTDMKTWIRKLQESLVQTAKATTPEDAKNILSDVSLSRKDIEEQINNLSFSCTSAFWI